LANIALHGLEEFIRSHFPTRTRRNSEHPGQQLHWQPQVIRYADDLVILHRDRTVIEQCRHLTQTWLQGIGLELSEQKTRIAHTLEKVAGEAGFNFLGFQVRQYRASKYNTAQGRGFKTLIRPSHGAMKRHWAMLSALISQHKAAKQANLIGILNPIIAGWANYYSAVVSTRTFHLLDHRLYESSDDGRFSGTRAKVGGGQSSDTGTPPPAKAGTSGISRDQRSTDTRVSLLCDTSKCKGRRAYTMGTGAIGRHGGANTQACRGASRRCCTNRQDAAKRADSTSSRKT